MKGSNRCDKPRPPMPEFYMPAMWPLDLQNAIVDWIGAWFWRRRMRRLLAQDTEGLFVWVAPVVWWSRAPVSRCV